MPGPDPLSLTFGLKAGDPGHPQAHNDERITINQIIALLGVDPEAEEYDSIAERLNDLENIYGTIVYVDAQIVGAIATAAGYTDSEVASAIATAALDATAKADSAEAGAIATAAADATAKADAAETDAIAAAAVYTDAEVASSEAAHLAALDPHAPYTPWVEFDDITGWPSVSGLAHPIVWYGPSGSQPENANGWQDGDVAVLFTSGSYPDGIVAPGGAVGDLPIWDGSDYLPQPSSQFLVTSGSRPLTGNQSFGGFRATNVGPPTSSGDALIVPRVAALTPTTGSITIDLGAEDYRTVTLTGNPSFFTSNRVQGRSIVVLITAGASSRTPTFPAWKWVGTKPTSFAANSTGLLSLLCLGGTGETNVIASYTAAV